MFYLRLSYLYIDFHSGNALSAKKGVFGKVGEIQTMLCLTFGPDNMTYSGTLGGDVYIWKNNTLQSVIEDPHIVSDNTDCYNDRLLYSNIFSYQIVGKY